MKKLIAFSVIFALLTGAVFAFEVGNFAAEFDIRVDLLDTGGAHSMTPGTAAIPADHYFPGSPAVPAVPGTTTSDPHAGGWDNGGTLKDPYQARFSFSYETSGGEAGISGSVRLERTPALEGFGTGWWKPIDLVKLSLGGTTFNRRLVEHEIWWDYENDGRHKTGASGNFIALEIGPFADDMVKLNLGFMGDAAAMTEIGDRYFKTLVAQAVFNLGDLGTAAVTFDYGSEVIIADYQATFSDINVKAAFGFKIDNSEMWGLSAQADTTIEGIGVLVRYNTDKFEGMQLFAEASYGMDLAELDFGTVRFAPKVNVALNIKNAKENDYGADDFVFGYEAPLTLTKIIDGFTLYTGLLISGNTNFSNFDNMFRLRVPFRFAYRF